MWLTFLSLSSLPPYVVRRLSLVRRLRSVPIRELLRYYSPIRLPLIFGSFLPTCRIIEPTLFRPFLSGMRRVSPVVLHILVTMLLLPPRQLCHFPFQSVSEGHAAFAIRLLARPAGFNHFRGYLCIYLRYGLVTCVPALQVTCQWASWVSFLPTMSFSYRTLTFVLMGLAPTGYVHLFWTHNRTW
jgi:hypothetical protein